MYWESTTPCWAARRNQLAAAEGAAGRFQPVADSVAPPPAPKAGNLDSGPALAKAQKVLGRLGYYKGPANGAMSSDLKLAVGAYQRDQGLAATEGESVTPPHPPFKRGGEDDKLSAIVDRVIFYRDQIAWEFSTVFHSRGAWHW